MAASAGLVHTATLNRGRIYVYKNEQYFRGQPKVVDEATAIELEELHNEVQDADGEMFQKDLFVVEFDVEPPASAEVEKPKRKRRRADADESRPAVKPRRRRRPQAA